MLLMRQKNNERPKENKDKKGKLRSNNSKKIKARDQRRTLNKHNTLKLYYIANLCQVRSHVALSMHHVIILFIHIICIVIF